jgi:hypothetical protein
MMTDEEKLRNAGWSPGSLSLAMNDQDSPLARRNEVSWDSDRLALKRQNTYPETPKSKYDREPKVLDQKVTPLIHDRHITIDLTCSTEKKNIQPPIFRDDDNDDDEIARLAKNFRRQSFQPKNLINYNEQDENKKPSPINVLRYGSNGNTDILSHSIQKSTSIKNYSANDGEKCSIDSNCDRNNKKNQNFQNDLCDNDSRRIESIFINNINNTDHNSSAHVHNNKHVDSSSKCENIMHGDFDISLINSDCSNNRKKISDNSNSNGHNIKDKSRNITCQPHLVQKLSINVEINNGEINNRLKAEVPLNIPQNHENRYQPSKVTISNNATERLDMKSNTRNEGGQLEKLLLAADLDSVLPNGIYSYVHIYLYVCICIDAYI